MIPRVQKHLSYSFATGLALFIVCLICVSQWKSYAPHIHQAVPTSPYLTPWTVLSVGALGLALALIAAPVRNQLPIQLILSKALSALVFCFAAVFLLEYASGIHVPDLDIFFLPDLSGQRVTLYAARPTPHSATTSLLFASAMLIYHRQTMWQKRVFQIIVLAAILLPAITSIGYLLHWLFRAHRSPEPRVGLSFPAVVLYLTLGSGFLGVAFSSIFVKPVVAPSAKVVRRSV